MKKWQKGIVLFIVILIVALGTMILFFPIESETGTPQYENEQLNFVTPINDIPQEENVVYIDNDEAKWIWQASHGVLDQFIDNYDGSIVSKEEWKRLTEDEREQLLIQNGQ